MLAQKETKYRAARILALSPTERAMQGLPLRLKDIAKLVGISPERITAWKKQLPEILDEMREDENRRQVQERLEKDKALRQIAEENLVDASNYNSNDWLQSRTIQADKALLRACEAGNAQALKTYYQLTQRLIEKQEVTHKLDADTLFRAREEGLRRQAELLGGDRGLPEQHLLPQEVWKDKRQD